MKKTLLLLMVLIITGCGVKRGTVVEKWTDPAHNHTEYKGYNHGETQSFRDRYFVRIMDIDGDTAVWQIPETEYKTINTGDIYAVDKDADAE